jgi:hypothetical protein
MLLIGGGGVSLSGSKNTPVCRITEDCITRKERKWPIKRPRGLSMADIKG